MDPNTCIDRINVALADKEWAEMEEACQELYAWIEDGGFSPNKLIDKDLAAEYEMVDQDNDEKASAYEALADLLDLFS